MKAYWLISSAESAGGASTRAPCAAIRTASNPITTAGTRKMGWRVQGSEGWGPRKAISYIYAFRGHGQAMAPQWHRNRDGARPPAVSKRHESLKRAPARTVSKTGKNRLVPGRHASSATRGMAVALKRGELNWNIAMRLSKPLLLAIIAAASISPAARAGDWTNSANYNGYGNTTQNTPYNFSLRDANGNLTLVNGQFVGSNFSSATGVGATNAMGGVGLSPGQINGQATAIGNSLNVVVVGNHNTTVVNSNKINNGNQTATADISGH